jgi:hypothetical protein
MSGIETPGLPHATGITGLERFAVDTEAASGVAPQTAYVSSCQAGFGAVQYSVPTTGFSITVAAGTSTVLIEPAGTLATGTFVFPVLANCQDGQSLRIASSQTVTAATFTAGSGTTIVGAPSAITLSTTGAYNYEFVFVLANTKWYRVQ